jgi:protein-S-isoprenylcysteine O-methyltransferase Ste14
MLGFVVAFWATPLMTVGHLVFTVATTAYILVGIQLEEHDLVKSHGDTYRAYQERTRMLIPLPKGGASQAEEEASSGTRANPGFFSV